MDMQKVAVERILNGENLFLTGGGGKGKSHVIDQITDSRTIKCAPTGGAAINIGGVTCHSLFGLPLGLPEKLDYYKVSKKMRSLIQDAGVTRVVIDEISLMRADMLDLIDSKLKTMMNNKLPFGGLQMVVVGDFYQIEPVIHFTEEEEYFNKYKSGFCFTAKSWKFQGIELTKSYRNVNNTQLAVLESIRTKDKWYKKALTWMKDKAKPYFDDSNHLHLCCYNRDARALNGIQYRVLQGEEFTYKGSVRDKFAIDQSTVKETIKLKKGTRVLVKANGGAYVNGDKGVVSYLDPDTIEVRLDRTGEVVNIEPFTWSQTEYKVSHKGLEAVVVGDFTQFPITLGYAVSIHSIQGATLDDVVIDVGDGCFAHGMFYVAVSRVRDLSNVSYVIEPTESDVICDPLVTEFYKTLER